MQSAILYRGLWVSLAAAKLGWAGPVQPYIINGTAVPDGQYTEVVRVTNAATSDTCGATIVGPRTIVTAAHCMKNATTLTFQVAGSSTTYTAAMTKSPDYPAKNLDLAVGIVNADIPNVKPATIGGTATTNLPMNLLGFGCTKPDQPSDGKLRIGQTVILATDSYQIKSGGANGAILCFGDSGGPSFIEMTPGKRVLVGVNAQGNMLNSNYSTRLDIEPSTTFLSGWAATNNTKICGIAGYTCDVIPPQPNDPSCTLKAVPNVIKVGSALTLNLTTANATSAMIEGQPATVPNDQKTIKPGATGDFIAHATVTNSVGKTANCQDSYRVTPDDPPIPPAGPVSCTISVTPDSEIYQGDIVTADIFTEGAVVFASIDGTPVKYPQGRKLITAKTPGDFAVIGFARSDKDPANCKTFFHVNSGVHPPPIPDFAAVPSYCGDNTKGTDVKQVCWAVIHREKGKKQSLRTPYALLLTNANGTKEILPIAARTPKTPQPGDPTVQEDLKLLANQVLPTNDSMVFDTRAAKLVRQATGPDETIVPVSLEGKSLQKLDFAATLTPVTPVGPSR